MSNEGHYKQGFKAIAYISLKTGEVFIRERQDFLKQFETLEKWEKEK